MSQSKIQIANSIVRNESVQLNAIEFVMLLMLKKYYFLSGKEDILELDPKKLMLNMGIGDNRTFKKVLDGVWEHEFILDKIEKLPRGKPIEVKLNVEKLEDQDKGFTQLPTGLLNKIDAIGCVGVRLLYLYESYINRKNKKVSYCYVGYDTIEECLGLSSATIATYNEKLVNANLLKITKHQLGTEYDYDEKDALVYDKWNNHYEVKIDQI